MTEDQYQYDAERLRYNRQVWNEQRQQLIGLLAQLGGEDVKDALLQVALLGKPDTLVPSLLGAMEGILERRRKDRRVEQQEL